VWGNADPEDVKQAIIDVLREDDGASLRALLKALRDPDAKRLYANLIQHPALRDLVPH
jgi:uncharacterized protein YjgD (DUF1641 family)